MVFPKLCLIQNSMWWSYTTPQCLWMESSIFSKKNSYQCFIVSRFYQNLNTVAWSWRLKKRNIDLRAMDTQNCLTSVNIIKPMKYETMERARINNSRLYPLRKTLGYMSTTAVTRLSTHTNWKKQIWGWERVWKKTEEIIVCNFFSMFQCIIFQYIYTSYLYFSLLVVCYSFLF